MNKKVINKLARVETLKTKMNGCTHNLIIISCTTLSQDVEFKLPSLSSKKKKKDRFMVNVLVVLHSFSLHESYLNMY